jgi:hypothetical protein
MPALVDLGLVPNLQAVVGLPIAEIVRRAAVVSADGQFAVRVPYGNGTRYAWGSETVKNRSMDLVFYNLPIEVAR